MIHVIDTYIVGIKEAKEMSIVDTKYLETVDDLLFSMSQYDEDNAKLTRLRETLEKALTS